MVSMDAIGTIRTSFKTKEDMPIQSSFCSSPGKVVLSQELSEGLKDLDLFSHMILLYQFHMSVGYSLTVTPFMDDAPHGIFATRAPKRPNPLGLSIVEIVRIEDNVIHFLGADMIDGTPLLDIKPYVKMFDHRSGATDGWVKGPPQRSDSRF